MGGPRRPRFTSLIYQSGRSSTFSSRIARILRPSLPRSSSTRLRTTLLVRTRLDTSKWLSTYRAGSKLIGSVRHCDFWSLPHALMFQTMCRTQNRSQNQHDCRHRKSHAGAAVYILVDHPELLLLRSVQVFDSAPRARRLRSARSWRRRPRRRRTPRGASTMTQCTARARRSRSASRASSRGGHSARAWPGAGGGGSVVSKSIKSPSSLPRTADCRSTEQPAPQYFRSH
jgi:hypothetical protein